VTGEDHADEPIAEPDEGGSDATGLGEGGDGTGAPDRAGEASAAPDRPARPVPERWQLWAVVGAVIVLFVGAQVGDALAPTLVTEHPLLLITLNSRNRNLILAVNNIDAPVFFVVASLRLLLSDPLFYLLGYWYGDSAVVWMERRSRSLGQGMRRFEEYFSYASYPLVAIAPNNAVCLLAGSSGMPPIVFLVLNIGGTIVRVALIMWLGETFEKPIDWLLDVIKEYRWYLMAISVSVVGFSAWRELRQGTSEVSGLKELAEHQDDEG
jgi:membrane protein DedA with SNARE-associated domain